MKTHPFLPGSAALLQKHPEWIASGRLGLLTHPAAVDCRGAPTTELIRRAAADRLTSLFGPEHGFFGLAGAGETVTGQRHPVLKIPVFSLYGTNRRPTDAMLRGIDTLLVDLQDLGVRCYTYCATLRYVLEAAAAMGKTVIVMDRPVPLPKTVDGPVVAPGFESFVAGIPGPMVYGLTPGETALWLTRELDLQLDLKVMPMCNYHRDPFPGKGWPPWIPPSPAILSWDSARCYPSTVFCEGLPTLDCGRGTGLPFQVLGAPWIRSERLLEALNSLNLGGVAFHYHQYVAKSGLHNGAILNAVRLTITDPILFQPIACSIHILHTLQSLYGTKHLWSSKEARPEFFDKLYGTDAVREALLDKESPRAILANWTRDLARFRRTRTTHMLYR